jgi:hypothetical protein
VSNSGLGYAEALKATRQALLEVVKILLTNQNNMSDVEIFDGLMNNIEGIVTPFNK